MAQTGLGIFISENRLTIAAAKKAIRQRSIEAYRTIPIPGINLSNEDDLQKATAAIRKFVSENKLKPDFVSVGLSSSDILWNWVEMPPVSRSELYQLMQYELELHVPLDPDAVFYDVMPVRELGAQNSKVLLITTPQAIVNQVMELSNRIDLPIDSIETEGIMHWRMLKNGPTENIVSSPDTIVVFSESGLEVILQHEGKPIFYRHHPYSEIWPYTDDDDTSPGTTPKMDPKNLLDAILLCKMGAGESINIEDLEEVTILGPPSQEFMEGIRDLFPGIHFHPIYAQDLMDIHDATIDEMTAITLASSFGNEQDCRINLLPADLRPVRRQTGLMITGALTGLLFSMIFLTMANAYFKVDLKTAQTKAAIAGMKDNVEKIMEINRGYDQILENYEFLKNMRYEYPIQLQILRVLTRLLPAESEEGINKVWLERYEARGSQITIRGNSKSPENLITILEESPYFEKVRFRGNVSGETFTIEAALSKIADVMLEDEGSDIETGSEDERESESKQDVSKPSPIPDVEGSLDDDEDDDVTYIDTDRQDDQERYRGPAFPRTRDEDIATENEPEDYYDDEEIPSDDVQMESNEQDVEEMKNNLFEFIRRHKEEGNVVERDRGEYEEPDPEEAAANFLEFLKAAAERKENSDEDL